MKVRLKNVVFGLMLLCITVGVTELACYATFACFKKRFTFFEFSKYFPEDRHIHKVARKYHPERGWDNWYSTEFGERRRGGDYDTSRISAFGDSHVRCDDVNDKETWEEYLAALLGENVYNFGTGGYGTDQAYLKFLEVFPKVRTPVVILGLATENISRIVNVYRPFYYERTGVWLTKPRFVLKQDRLVLLPNPVRTPEEIQRLRSASFLRQIGQNDFWFNRDRYPEFKFPYLRILCNKRIWSEIVQGLGRNRISDIAPRPYVDLWEDAEAVALMHKILESFVVHAKEYEAVPVIMIMPCREQVMERFLHKENSMGEEKILDFCRARHVLVFNAIEALAKRADSAGQVESFFRGHVSARGNRLVAEGLFDFLRDHGLGTRK